MLKMRLNHPEIFEALAGSGHFSQVLIATGEKRRFANLLLEIGAVKLAEENF